jgi:threonine dehydrogenase-like Zn-dependent dehydrogenase
MRAIIYTKRRGVQLQTNRPLPALKGGEVLVRVRLAGICNTDLEITRGYMDFEGVLGHEFVGQIFDAADKSAVGMRVVGEINCACGKCPTCKGGLEKHCPSRTVLGILGRDGCFADIVSLPAKNLHPVPDDVNDEKAVFTEPLAAALQILEQIEPRRGEEIAVLGDGKLGLLAAMVLAEEYGKRVFAVGHHKEKLDILKHTRAKRMLESELGKERFDVVVDCTGSAGGFRRAVALTRPGGILVLKSTFAAAGSLNLAPVVIDEITVIGSRCGPFDKALKALEDRRVDPRALITKVYDLDQGIKAIKHAQTKEAVKVLLRVW